jgi:ATP-dependent Lhr-like helicase
VIIEERLKKGTLPAIVATSVARARHRHGRGRSRRADRGAAVGELGPPAHRPREPPRSGRVARRVFPKHRADLLASAARSCRACWRRGREDRLPDATRSTCSRSSSSRSSAMDELQVDEAFRRPRARLRRLSPSSRAAIVRGVLDMLVGPLSRRTTSPSCARASRGTASRAPCGAREGAKRIAILNAAPSPTAASTACSSRRAPATGRGEPSRVGELDEEMVFESRVGEVFLLGATSWRIEEITHDRVLVSPRPGQPGKMPFWHGDRPAGRRGSAARSESCRAKLRAAKRRGERLEARRASTGSTRAPPRTCRYVASRRRPTGDVPSDKTIVIERFQ